MEYDVQLYQFSAKSLQGKTVNMERLKGKTVLVVNTASKCGLTLNTKAWRRFISDKRISLVNFGFPCKLACQPGAWRWEAYPENCLINYGVTFPMFSKIDVNGPATDPLFVYLKRELPGWLGNRIKWNFTKFLIDANGKPVKRFVPFTAPAKIEPYIQQLLK